MTKRTGKSHTLMLLGSRLVVFMNGYCECYKARQTMVWNDAPEQGFPTGPLLSFPLDRNSVRHGAAQLVRIEVT